MRQKLGLLRKDFNIDASKELGRQKGRGEEKRIVSSPNVTLASEDSWVQVSYHSSTESFSGP